MSKRKYVKRNPNQIALAFDDTPEDDAANLARVNARIAMHVKAFVADVLAADGTFHMADLLAYVRERVPDTAPDSAGRILRDLRQKGEIDYMVLDRRASLYEAF